MPETEKLYLRDSYLRRSSATVQRVVREKGRRYYLALDATIFHPLGGGQPSDTGLIRSEGMLFEVKKALESGGVIVLYGKALEGEPEEGVTVIQELDWGRRYLIMRLHTAGHVVDRAVTEVLGTQVNTLGAMHGPPRAFVEYGARLDAGILGKIEELANDLLDDREVVVKEVSPEELPSSIYGAPNLGRLPEARVYRVIEVRGINAIPCTGTHVARTSEVGEILITGLEEVEGGSRVYYDVEPK